MLMPDLEIERTDWEKGKIWGKASDYGRRESGLTFCKTDRSAKERGDRQRKYEENL